MPRVVFRNFTGGEVTPTLSARYDLKKFGSFLQVCRNFIPNLHGDVERRPGFRWVDTIPPDKRDNSSPCGAVLIPFMFNTEPENNYLLIFRFDGWITVAGCKCDEYGQAVRPIEYVPLGCAEMRHNYVPPYELYELSYAQVGDVLYVAHPNHSLMKLERSDEYPYAWSFTPVAINQSLPKPEAPSVTWVKGNPDDNSETNYELNYVVSAVGGDGVESLPSEVGKCTGKYPTDWVTGNHVALAWAPVPGAVQYNVYREAAGYFGFIATVDQPTEGNVRFQDNNIEPDTAITPKEDWDPFKETVNGVDKANNPATVCFHHQRMWLGGGSLHPATLYASRTGDFENFRKSRPLQDDDPLEFMLASGFIDDVKWLASFDQLLVGTAGSEYKASSSGAAITPSDCQVTAQSYWGSSSLQPILVGQSILHTQRANQHVRDLYYTWESDSYTGNDLSILAPQLVEGHKLLQWAFQQSASCLWIVRDDGTLLCLTYMKEQNVFGWSVHQVGDDGKVISVAAINGEAEDVVFIVVQRGDVYTLERLERKFSDQDGIADSFYLDCARTFTGSNLTSISGTETVAQSWLTAKVVSGSSSIPSESPSTPAPSQSSGGVDYEEDGTTIGTSGSDVIVGTSSGDNIYPRGGRDTIYGGAGDDTIHGGSGTREVYGEEGNDVIAYPGDGGKADGGAGDDTLYGGSGNVTLTGGTGANVFYINFPEGKENVITDAKSTDRIIWNRGSGTNWAFSTSMWADGDDLVIAESDQYTAGIPGTLRLIGWVASNDRPTQIEVIDALSSSPIQLSL